MGPTCGAAASESIRHGERIRMLRRENPVERPSAAAPLPSPGPVREQAQERVAAEYVAADQGLGGASTWRSHLPHSWEGTVHPRGLSGCMW